MFMPALTDDLEGLADLRGRRSEADDVERRPQGAAREDRNAVDVDEQTVAIDVVVGAGAGGQRPEPDPAALDGLGRPSIPRPPGGRRRGQADRACAATSARRPATRTSPLATIEPGVGGPVERERSARRRRRIAGAVEDDIDGRRARATDDPEPDA